LYDGRLSVRWAEFKKPQEKIVGKFLPVDVHVGTRVRQRRSLLGMSQTTLGKAVGLTFQQIQKYERGANRIGSSRLYEFAAVLDVPVSYFFDDMPPDGLKARDHKRRAKTAARAEVGKDPLIKRETLELVRAYYKIRNTTVRKRIRDTILGLSSMGERSVRSR
jgi:transcriptional regulator with XRE-family HTH domain